MRHSLALLLVACLLLAACGQKGPLFLPDDEDEQSVAPPPQSRSTV